MVVEGLEITAVGMTSVFLFLLLLVVSMNVLAAIFKYLGVEDECPAPKKEEDDDALIAAVVAVKLKNS